MRYHSVQALNCISQVPYMLLHFSHPLSFFYIYFLYFTGTVFRFIAIGFIVTDYCTRAYIQRDISFFFFFYDRITVHSPIGDRAEDHGTSAGAREPRDGREFVRLLRATKSVATKWQTLRSLSR